MKLLFIRKDFVTISAQSLYVLYDRFAGNLYAAVGKTSYDFVCIHRMVFVCVFTENVPQNKQFDFMYVVCHKCLLPHFL